MKKLALMCALFTASLFLCAFLSSPPSKNITTTSGDFNALNVKIHTVAVLPIDNTTNKQIAGKWVRKALIEGFESFRYYTVLNEEITDKKLKEAGISDIHASSPRKIGTVLGADAIIYTRLAKFKESVNLAFGSVETSARIQMVDISAQKIIYDSQQTDTTTGITPGGIIFASLQAVRNLRNKLLKKYPLKKKVETYKRRK